MGSLTVYGQFTSGSDFGGGAGVSDTIATVSDEFDISDARIEYFTSDDPFAFQHLDTGLLWFHRFNPAYQSEFGYTDLGNLGTAARPVVFRPAGQVGFDAGRHAFDPYYHDLEEIRYFRPNKPYTEAHYVLGSKLEQLFNVRHSQQPFPNLNFSLDYTRLVSVGSISHHKTGIHRLGMTGWYRSPNRRYAALVGFAFNALENQENWGLAISDDSATNVIREEIPVNLLSPETLERGRGLQVKQFWNLGPAYTRIYNDSTRLAKIQPHWRVYHDFRYKRQTFTYQDLSVDTLFYQTINFDSDTTITNWGYRRYINRFGLRSNSHLLKGDSLVPNRMLVDLAGGLDFGYHEDTAARRNISIAFLEFDIGLKPSRKNPLYLNVSGSAASTGEFDLDAGIGISGFGRKPAPDSATVAAVDDKISVLTKGGKATGVAADSIEQTTPEQPTITATAPSDSVSLLTLALDSARLADSLRLDSIYKTLPALRMEQSPRQTFAPEARYSIGGGIRASRYEPSQLMRFFLSNHALWNNDFAAQNSIGPYFRLQHTGTRTRLEVRYTLVDNFLYWDEAATPAQIGAAQGVFAILLSQDFKLGYFHFDNEVALQFTGSDLIHLPLYRGRHNFYFQKNIFQNALFAQLGVDIFFSSPYLVDRYDPLTAQYFLQQSEENIFVPDVDVYFSAIVKRARFFLKARYLTGGFQAPVNFQSIGYPTEGFGLELGVDWAFWY